MYCSAYFRWNSSEEEYFLGKFQFNAVFFLKKSCSSLFLQFPGCLFLLPIAGNNMDDDLVIIFQFHLLFSEISFIV